MREEVEAIIDEEGWTKAAIGRMRKVDSFLRESIRLNGFGASSSSALHSSSLADSTPVGLNRKVMKPFTLSDGTYLPPGTEVAIPSDSIHHDGDNYVNPHEFDGFRFSRMREVEGESSKYQFTNLGLDYVPFGSGKHAW